MATLAKAVRDGGVTYPAGTVHTALPQALSDKLRNERWWVSGTVPALFSPAAEKKIDLTNVTATQARAAIGVTAGLKVTEGSNAAQGVATLVSGTVTVANTRVAATSRIFLTVQSLGTVTAAKAVAVTARVNGTSFTITSSDNTDTSVVAWEIFTPA